MVESLLLHRYSLALSTTLSSTVTSWCQLHVVCAATGLHTGQRHSVFRLRVQPAVTTQCHQLTSSGGPHWQCHRRCNVNATQLSFLEFPKPSPTLLLDAATQTSPHSAASADATTQLSLTEFFLGCIYSKDSLDRSVPPPAHGQTCPTCARPIPTLLLDAAAQTPSHSVASADATTQLPLTEFFLGCVYTNDPLDRCVPPPTHGNASSASLPQPIDIATIYSPSSTSRTSGRLHAHAPSAPRPESRELCPLVASHVIPVKAAPVRPRLRTSTSFPSPQPHVCTTQVGTHAVRSSTTHKRSASTAPAGTHHAVGADPRAGRVPFPKPRALVLSMVKFGHTKPDGLGDIDTADSDLMHHQYRLSVLQWNPGPARRNPTNIITATCGRFHAVILQEASDHVPHITGQFTRTSPSCSTRTPLSPILWFSSSKKTPQAKVRGAWHYSSFEDCCAALLFLAHRRSHVALCTSTMLWRRNVTLPLTSYGGYMGTWSSTTLTSSEVTST